MVLMCEFELIMVSTFGTASLPIWPAIVFAVLPPMPDPLTAVDGSFRVDCGVPCWLPLDIDDDVNFPLTSCLADDILDGFSGAPMDALL